MKTLSIMVLSFVTALSFANPRNDKIEYTIISSIEDTTRATEVFACSVTASGTATLSDGTTVSLTITVTGPCNSSLAGKMRAAITQAREDMVLL